MLQKIENKKVKKKTRYTLIMFVNICKFITKRTFMVYHILALGNLSIYGSPCNQNCPTNFIIRVVR